VRVNIKESVCPKILEKTFSSMPSDGTGTSLAVALERLGSADPDVQRAAARDLAALGDPAALPALVKTFPTENWLVRGACVRAILAIGGGQGLGDFMQALHNGDARIRNAAIEIFRGLGRRVVEPLQGLLKDPDAAVARYAVELLGEIGDPVAAPALLPIAEFHSDENTRYQALLALGKLGSRSSVPVLRKALSASLWVQTAALEAIGQLGTSDFEEDLLSLIGKTEIWALPTVLDALGRVGTAKSLQPLYNFIVSDEELSQLALRALARVASRTGAPLVFEGKDRENILGVAHRAIASEDAELRRAGIDVAGLLRDEGACGALLPLLSAKDAGGQEEIDNEEAAAAARALSAIGAAAESPLLAGFAGMNLPGQILAIDVLGKVGGAKSVVLLVQLLDHDDVEINRAACEALGRIRDLKSVDPLIDQFQHPSAAVRSAAQRALARFPVAVVFDRLLALLQDPLSEVRAMAAGTLGELRDARATEPLKHLLLDQSNEVKQAAVFALASLEERKVGSLPLLLLGNDDPVLRRSAAQVLGQLHDPRGVEPLMFLLGDPDFWVRFQAARALGLIGDTRATVPLRERLRDPMGPVRVAAAEALLRLAGDGAISDIALLVGDQDPDVRAAVVDLFTGRREAVVREAILRALEDSAWRVRHGALRAAAKTPDEKILGLARACLRDEHVLVRQEALSLIEHMERSVGIGGIS
ncbi:MAG: HEAT repeat domain-containing protein, partial [Bdellovibrionota bacterium]